MKSKIHPTAVIDNSAEIEEGVIVGPYAYIGEKVEIKKGTIVSPFAMIYGFSKIGENCKIFPYAVVGTPPQDISFSGEESYVIIGNNTTIREFATINRGSKKEQCKTIIGDNCLIMAYVHIAHDCVIGNNVIIVNAANLAGHVIVEDYAIIGGLVGVHQFVRIGKYAFIGGCSGVLQDVPPFAKAWGNRVKLYGINSVGLRRHNFPEETIKNLRKAYKLLLYSGLNTSQALEKIKEEIKNSPEVDYLVEFIRNSKRGICK